MSHFNHHKFVARQNHFRQLQRPRILRLYRDLLKQINQFVTVTNPYDKILTEQLIENTRQDFRKNKSEQRPRHLIKFMTSKRELLYDLRDANDSVDRADEIEPNIKFSLNDHMRKVYRIVVEAHYKE